MVGISMKFVNVTWGLDSVAGKYSVAGNYSITGNLRDVTKYVRIWVIVV